MAAAAGPWCFEPALLSSKADNPRLAPAQGEHTHWVALSGVANAAHWPPGKITGPARIIN